MNKIMLKKNLKKISLNKIKIQIKNRINNLKNKLINNHQINNNKEKKLILS